MNPHENLSGYEDEYNELLSSASYEIKNRFATIASPTLNKQETVTKLYQRVINGKGVNFPLRQLFLFPFKFLLFFLELIFVSIRFRVEKLPSNAIFFRSWLEPRATTRNMIFDEHFRTLPEDLAKYCKVVVLFQPTSYALLLKLKANQLPNNYFIAGGLLNIPDIIVLCIRYLFGAFIQVKGEYVFRGVNIKKSINNSLKEDYLSLRSFIAYLDSSVCEKIKICNPKAFIYVFENQAWEKACCASFREHAVRTVGYQGSGFSPFFLNFFPTNRDIRKKHLYPNVVLTVGDLFTKFLKVNSRFQMPIKTFAALRFPYKSSEGMYSVSPPNPQIFGRILYAFPVHVDQYKHILKDLISQFADSAIKVDLKPHPQYAPLKIFDSLPSNFNLIYELNPYDLSKLYDAVIFNDNSFGIESLMLGVRSYQFVKPDLINSNRFFYFDLWDTDIDLVGLGKLKKEILKGTFQKNFDTKAVQNYINQMYKPYTGELSLLLDELGLSA